MEEKVRNDILAILNRSAEILKVKEEKSVIELKELSNHTIHNASVFQDEDSVSIAVIVYALSKIIERKEGEIPKNITEIIETAMDCLQKNQLEDYRRTIKSLIREISKIDAKLKLYISEVIEQGEIKKSSKLYEHGISIAQSAEVLGVSQWDLMNYIGKTKIADSAYEKTDIASRIKFARSLFR